MITVTVPVWLLLEESAVEQYSELVAEILDAELHEEVPRVRCWGVRVHDQHLVTICETAVKALTGPTYRTLLQRVGQHARQSMGLLKRPEVSCATP